MAVNTTHIKLAGVGISALTECFEIYGEVKDHSGPLSVSQRINIAVKTVFVALQARSLNAKKRGTSHETRKDLKAAEFVASLVHLGTDTGTKLAADIPNKEKFSAFIGNLSKSMRLAAEVDMLHEKTCLAEMREDSDFLDVDLEECRNAIEGAKSTASTCLLTEVIVKTGGLTFAAEQVESYLAYIVDARTAHATRVAGDEEDLTARATIPDEYEEDEVFSQYICPITQVPIRYPRRDPQTGHIYEAHAIIGWLELNPTSPLTRSPLTPAELEEVPEIQAQIETRLRELQRDVADSSSDGD